MHDMTKNVNLWMEKEKISPEHKKKFTKDKFLFQFHLSGTPYIYN
jgi:hypothetical protein